MGPMDIARHVLGRFVRTRYVISRPYKTFLALAVVHELPDDDHTKDEDRATGDGRRKRVENRGFKEEIERYDMTLEQEEEAAARLPAKMKPRNSKASNESGTGNSNSNTIIAIPIPIPIASHRIHSSSSPYQKP